MTLPAPSLLSNEVIAQLVGHETLARAMVYARSGRVHDVRLDLETMTITGEVAGSYRDSYHVQVMLAGSRSGGTTVFHGRCSCPVGLDCKHAAAVLIVARHLPGMGRAVDRPDWEKAVDRLLSAPPPRPPAEVLPLGLEIEVENIPAYRGYAGRRELRIRPLRPGRQGKWVRSGVSWEELDFATRTYPEDHRELLLQLRSAVGASARYALPRGPWLSLGTATPALWRLLAQAGEIGVEIVPSRAAAVMLDDRGVQLQLDLRRADTGGLLVTPRLHTDDLVLPGDALGLLGDPAHGVFWMTRDHGSGPSTIHLARLETPLSRELRQFVLDRRPIAVPDGDAQRFLSDFVPPLRQQVALGSSDASVLLPQRVEPRLRLTVGFRPEHRLRLDWEVVYDLPGGPRAYALDDAVDRASPRSVAAEQQLLDALPLQSGDLPLTAPGRAREGRQHPVPHALLEGVAAFTVVERVLPRLEDAGVEVVREGAVVDYRETSAAPSVEVSARDRADSSDWFDLHITVSIEGEPVGFDELFVALSNDEDYLITETGVYCPLDRPELVKLRALIEESKALAEVDDGSGVRISRYQLSLWEELVSLGVVIEQSVRWTRAVRALRGAADADADTIPLPSGLRATLRPYQLDGYRWLERLRSLGLGGILADDMGLGKTVQSLAMICRARELAPDDPPFLVVAPTSVVANWRHEAARFAPGLSVTTVNQTTAKRKSSLSGMIGSADVVVTSYALLRIDADAYAAQEWAGVILDEAQFVKNHRARTYAAARRLGAPTTIAVTGTPVENSLSDLWSLLSLTAPGLFPQPERFNEYYRRPIERGRDTERLHQLQRRIRPLLLRRTKEAVAPELPPKTEQVIEVELGAKHARIYQTYLQRERRKVLGLIEDLDRNRFTVLRSLTLLRQLALDPALVDDAHRGTPAAKVDLLLEHLDELVAEGHQALVFSQFTGFLRTVRDRIDAAGISCAYLDGRTRDRERVIERFRAREASVFLISLKAGGFGLNLTEADYCFVLDPWWNPATEAQAVDRTHRIGQTKSVMVYRLVAQHTIEQKVMELKARKAELFSSLLEGDALTSSALSATDIAELLAAS